MSDTSGSSRTPTRRRHGPSDIGEFLNTSTVDDDEQQQQSPRHYESPIHNNHNNNNNNYKSHTSFHSEEEDENEDGAARDGIMKVGAVITSSSSTSTSPTVVVVEEGNSNIRQTIAGIAGNVLEWYDFAVFGYLSDVLGKVFFPPQAGNRATMESFMVFGGAFLMRPVGGVLLGYIGDVYGRKKALVLSIFLMAFPTFAMGCLPTYEQVGDWAIMFLILIRLLQGLSVGGQLMSSLIFTLESHERSKWGLYGSFVMAAANFGTLLGGFIGFVIRETLTEQQLISWGWRIPFLAGIVVSFSGFYLKSHGGDHDGQHVPIPQEPAADDGNHKNDEMNNNNNNNSGSYHDDENDHDDSSYNRFDEEGTTTTTTTTTTNHPRIIRQRIIRMPPNNNPLCRAIEPKNLRALLGASMVPMLWSAGFYLSFVWMAIYMTDLIEDPVPGSFGVNSMSLLFSVCLFYPVAGHMSDIYGRKRIMLVGGIGIGIMGPIMLVIIGQGNAILAFLAQCVLGVLLSCWGAPMCAWLGEAFEPAARLTSVSIGYNIAQALAGGTTPAFATFLVDKYSPRAPGIILTVLATIAVVGLVFVAPAHHAPHHHHHHHGRKQAIPQSPQDCNGVSMEMTSTAVVSEDGNELI